MEYALKDSGGELRAAMSGRFTFSDVGTFKDMIGHIKEAKGRRFVIDVAAVSFIDSAAMGMLLMARDAAAAEAVPLALAGAQGQVRRILDVAKFDTLFETVD
jgi:anti-anti-sigma factor